ncbi:MAG: MBL fold metallo-hydrolase [Spirochaetes bacterium]|nr:MBL fold metallo-hydrolase [Spirochaetota bacterium]
MNKPARIRHKEIHPGIFRIILPLQGTKPGPVNAYLFTGKPVTLLDTGTLKSAPVLERELGRMGFGFSDIEQIVLTHGHIDHYGAALSIIRGAGRPVPVLAHEEDRRLIEHGLEVPEKQFAKYYSLMGVPLIFHVSLLLVQALFKSMAENCRVDRTISDADRIMLGSYEATVVGTPGHTRGSVSFFLEKEGILFPGDHILGHITPNAFVMLEADYILPRRMSQVEFYESLAKIEKLSPRIAYPAHGSPIEDVSATIAMFREQFALRQKHIIDILEQGENTVYRIGRKLFPDIRGKRLPLEIFLMVSEVYTHLQVLQKENAVASNKKKGALYFHLI